MKNKCWKICAIVLLLMSLFCFLYGCSRKFYFSTMVVADGTQSDPISVLTLIVNFMNNNMTYISIYLALLTIVIGIMELLGVRKAEKYEVKIDKQIAENKQELDIKIAEYRQKTDIKIAEYRQESDTKIAEYCKKVDDCLKATDYIEKDYENIKNKQSISNLYMQKINQWMYENTSNIAQVSGSKSSKNIMDKAYLKYYLVKLHLCDDKPEIDQCINVIKQKGGADEIEALQLIVDNDMNKYKKEKAIEAIGYIRARLRTQEGESQNI